MGCLEATCPRQGLQLGQPLGQEDGPDAGAGVPQSSVMACFLPSPVGRLLRAPPKPLSWPPAPAVIGTCASSAEGGRLPVLEKLLKIVAADRRGFNYLENLLKWTAASPGAND